MRTQLLILLAGVLLQVAQGAYCHGKPGARLVNN